MRIAIFGPGAIGRLFAGFFRQGGHQVVMVCRREQQAQALRDGGLTWVDVTGAARQYDVEAVTGTAGADVDLALLTVKSYDTRAAAHLLPVGVPVLSLQNGLGNGETLAEVIDPSQLSVGLTTHGATAEGDTVVHYRGAGQTVIGEWGQTGPAHQWVELLNACGHPAVLRADIRTEVWRKAMVNIGINPFTALYRISNGELLDSPSLLRVMRLTVEEAESVAALEAISLENSFARVEEVCRQTAANTSSMLQDILAGRRTEIESLCGVIEAIGQRHGAVTPYNTMLLELIRALQTAKKTS